MFRKTLLICGIASSLLYVAMNVFVAMQWDGYSSASQTVSELSAIGAPTRSLWATPGAFYTVLVTAFGWGVWKSAGENRALRNVGRLIVGYGALGLLWPLAPMHLREALAAGGGTFSDTLHIALGAITVLLMLAAMVVGAAAFGKRFRLYSAGSLAVLMVFAALTFMDAPGISQNQPTPWIGVWERINIGVFLLWVVVLAIALWDRRDVAAGSCLPDHRAFKTLEGEAAYLAAYAEAMKLWPVPYEERVIPGRFGRTHVIVSGPKGAAPLVLLHGYWATLAMWSLNVADLSKNHRVYAIDIMGQPGLSIPGEPIRTAADYIDWLTDTLDGLDLDRVSLVGMSYGAWLGLSYAIAVPARVQKLVLLSPAASLVPLVKQFSLRGMMMFLCPARITVGWFMRWLGTRDGRRNPAVRRLSNTLVDLMWLGLKHYRFQPVTMQVVPTVFTDDELRLLVMPTLLLIGEREVIYDPQAALDRAHNCILGLEGELVPNTSHDMTFVAQQLVDARILQFLRDNRHGVSRKAS
jgi:pimeloyl-ACP methyl ester carboxylesterase